MGRLDRFDYDVAAGDLADHANTLRMVARYMADDFGDVHADLLGYPVTGLDDRDNLGTLVVETLHDLNTLADELDHAARQLDETASALVAALDDLGADE